MHLRPAHAKGLLLIVCMIMVICLIERTLQLRHLLATSVVQSQSVATTAQPDTLLQQELSPGLKPCELSAHSIVCAQPLFFDGAILTLLTILSVLALFIALRPETYRDKPVPIPRLRIHLYHCVFRE